MAKCFRCRRRKAKRRCPALGEELCSLCCGRHRHRDISCPPDCPFLSKDSSSRDRRAREKDEEEFWKDERLVWLVHHASRPLWIFAERIPSFSDGDAVQALEHARDETVRAHSLILSPGTAVRPSHEAGEAILRSMESCRFEGRIILPGRESSYSRDEKLKVLDVLLSAARSFAGQDPGGRGFLRQLVERHRRAEGTPSPGKTVTSG